MHTRTFSTADVIVTADAVYVQDFAYTNIEPQPFRVKAFFGNACRKFKTFADASEWLWDRGAIINKLIVMQDTQQEPPYDITGEFII